MKDEQIIKLFFDRDENAIAETEKKYSKYCGKVAFHILHDNEDVKECLNDTYLRAWKSIPPKNPNCLATYLGKITRNLAIDKFKTYSAAKRGSGQVDLVLSELEGCIPAAVGIEQVMEEKMLTQAINTFLHAQSQEKRNIFVRRYWYLHSIKEIATAYHLSESKVTSILFRMRGELKEHLEKEGIVI